ncbi:MAG: ABC transporter substrate-binding protein [Christensenellaceae bacterium]|nr:ABC transporter substrate-binding protein [Christensenellaceae bacterium]
MKKFITFITTIAMLFTMVFSVAAEETPVRLGGLKGATTMSLVKLLDDNENGKASQKYDFTMAVTADELTPLFIKGEMDIIAVPTNLASVLYNKLEGNANLLAISATGVLYVVEKGEENIKSLKDLKGKTVYATGKGTTPEMAMRYLLSKEGLSLDEDIDMVWLSEPTEAVAKLNGQEKGIALLPQPFVTVAQKSVEGLNIAISLDEEWKRLGDGSMLTTACVVARKDFVQNNPEKVELFLKDFAGSVEFVNSDTDSSSQLIEKYDIIKAPIAKIAIPYCNISAITGNDMKNAASGYLEALFSLKPESVGGALPTDDFYYGAE